MQISKCLLMVGAAICVTAVSLGADNDAQLRAREALGKNFNELDSQTSAAPARAVLVVPPQADPPAPAAVSAPATLLAATSSSVQQEVPQADAATIARAREALRQLQETNPVQVAPPPVAPTPPPAPAATIAAPPPAPPVATPPPAPVAVKPPPPAPLPAPAVAPNVQRVDAATIERAREALRQTAQQPLAGEVPPSPVAVSTPAPAPVTTPAPAPAVLPQVPTPAPAVAAPPVPAPPDFTSPTSAAGSAANKAALTAKMREAERNMQPSPALQANPPTGKTATSPALEQVKKSKGLQFPPLEGPPLPISAQKQERLQALLQKYMADQITPETYHSERAKILAEP